MPIMYLAIHTPFIYTYYRCLFSTSLDHWLAEDKLKQYCLRVPVRSSRDVVGILRFSICKREQKQRS